MTGAHEPERRGTPIGQPGSRFAPRLVSGPGEGLEVEVEIPDGPDGRPSTEDILAAMTEAAEALFPGIAGKTSA